MATAETVQLNSAHPPKIESIKVYKEIEAELKKSLQSLRHDHDKHEPEYFATVKDLSDEQLVNFTELDFVEVRVGNSAYGIHLFGRISLTEVSPQHSIFFRAFVPGEAEHARLHSIHTEERENQDGTKSFRAIFVESDALEWFDT